MSTRDRGVGGHVRESPTVDPSRPVRRSQKAHPELWHLGQGTPIFFYRSIQFPHRSIMVDEREGRAPRVESTTLGSRALLVILRIYLGVVLIVASWGKVTGSWNGERLEGVIGALGSNTSAFYQGVLDAVVLPNSGLFAGVVAGGEVLLGLALLTGTATRLTGAVGAFVFLNYMLLKGHWFWTPSSNDAAFLVISLVLVLGAAGRTLGVDAYLQRRWPRVPLW